MNEIRMRFLAATFTTMSVVATGVLAHAAKTGEPVHAAALGRPGDPDKVSRTIEVDMSDAMRFSPATIQVKRGETIRFRVKNVGRVKHEFVLGTLKELKQHAALM